MQDISWSCGRVANKKTDEIVKVDCSLLPAADGSMANDALSFEDVCGSILLKNGHQVAMNQPSHT